MNLDQERRRGEQADRILSDPLFREAIEKARVKAQRAFTDSKPDDAASLLKARLYYDCAEEFINDLLEVVNTGRLAQEDLLAREKIAKARANGPKLHI